MDTYAEPGPSGISSYDDDNDTDMVSEVCTFNSHFNLLASQAAQLCYLRRHTFPLKSFMYDFHCMYFTIILRSQLAGHKVCIARVPGKALYKFKNDLFYSLRLGVKETNLAMMLFFNHQAVNKCLQVIQMKLQ